MLFFIWLPLRCCIKSTDQITLKKSTPPWWKVGIVSKERISIKITKKICQKTNSGMVTLKSHNTVFVRRSYNFTWFFSIDKLKNFRSIRISSIFDKYVFLFCSLLHWEIILRNSSLCFLEPSVCNIVLFLNTLENHIYKF